MATTYTAVVKRDKLNNIPIPETLQGNSFIVTFTAISEEEARKLEFKSLKGIAGRELNLDDVRRERLGV